MTSIKISQKEIEEKICINLKVKKATGPDGVSSFKVCRYVYCSISHERV